VYEGSVAAAWLYELENDSGNSPIGRLIRQPTKAMLRERLFPTNVAQGLCRASTYSWRCLMRCLVRRWPICAPPVWLDAR
jgi:hypothetical protein